MEENLPQPQVPVVSVPPVQPPIPTKRLPLKWILIIALLAGIVLAGTFLIFKFQFSYPPTVYLKISPKFPDQIFLTENDIDIEKVMEGPFALISTAIWDKNEFQKAGYPLQEKYLKSENIMVDGVNAVKVSGTISEDSEGLYLAGIYHQEIYFPINDKIIHFMFYEDPSSNIKLLDQILSTFKFTDQTNTEAKFCGGIANIECPTGYTCKLGGSYPDAGGKCVVKE